jgi:hypothetical protein
VSISAAQETSKVSPRGVIVNAGQQDLGNVTSIVDSFD